MALIMVRAARDEYDAVTVGDAMESAGATVFAIKDAVALAPKCLVYCKIPNNLFYDVVDEAIGAAHGD